MSDIAPRFISATEVCSVLTWPMVIEAVEEAMKAATQKVSTECGSSYVSQPARQNTKVGIDTGMLFTMPGFVGNYQLSTNTAHPKEKGDNGKNDTRDCNTLACKLVTSFQKNALHDPPLPNIIANILLFSSSTGQLKCVMDATQITAWRTAAASVVATNYLYFQRNSEMYKDSSIQLAIIGCGTQGESHALGMCATHRVSRVLLWNRTPARAHALKNKLRSILGNEQVDVQVAQTAAEAVANADVICVGTFSAEALVTLPMLQKPNVHINAVGAGEVHFGEVAQDIYDKANVYIDSWANAKAELKDLKANIVDEVGQIIRAQRYPPQDGITIFQSLGMASEDVTVAQAVYNAL